MEMIAISVWVCGTCDLPNPNDWKTCTCGERK